MESDAEEFVETFSDINYDLHVRQAKEAARIFKKSDQHGFQILKPIAENEAS